VRTNKDRQRARRQARRKKLRYLRRRLAEAKTSKEREQLIDKIRRVSPAAPIPEE
jgi:hypothetical protein